MLSINLEAKEGLILYGVCYREQGDISFYGDSKGILEVDLGYFDTMFGRGEIIV